ASTSVSGTGGPLMRGRARFGRRATLIVSSGRPGVAPDACGRPAPAGPPCAGAGAEEARRWEVHLQRQWWPPRRGGRVPLPPWRRSAETRECLGGARPERSAEGALALREGRPCCRPPAAASAP